MLLIRRIGLSLIFILCGARLSGQEYNVVIILADDLGYSDLGAYGGKPLTPNLDNLARNGITFTEFYASPICSPSRASLMTGCYPQRVGIPSVIGGKSTVGIRAEEKLLPEMLKEKGYRTALVGKWHLGRLPAFHPQNHGFDEYFGTVASNDDGVDMSTLAVRRYGHAGFPLLDGRDTVAFNPRQWELTRRYTERSVDFITKNKNRPFFLYLAYNTPHTPLFIRDEFAGKSKVGVYQDVLMEIDWSVGKVVQALEDNNLTRKTLVVFLSDNGPWLIFGNHGGSASPLSGGKKQTLEGGVRVPCIMSLPGLIPAGTVCSEIASIMDLYPTVAALTGARRTKEKIDGHNILPLMKAERNARSPYQAYYYYYKNALQAVRSGNFKLQLQHQDGEAPDPEHPGYDGHRGDVHTVSRPMALFDLKSDPSETRDVASQYPAVVKKLLAIAEQARDELGDSLTGRKGSEIRDGAAATH